MEEKNRFVFFIDHNSVTAWQNEGIRQEVVIARVEAMLNILKDDFQRQFEEE